MIEISVLALAISSLSLAVVTRQAPRTIVWLSRAVAVIVAAVCVAVFAIRMIQT